MTHKLTCCSDTLGAYVVLTGLGVFWQLLNTIMLVKNNLVVRLKTTTGRKKRRRIRSWRLTRLRAEPHRRSHYPVSFREHKSCCSDGCWMQLTIAILMDFLSLVLSWVDCVTWNFSIVIKVAAWNCLNRWNVEIILLCAIYSSRLCWWGR